MNTQKIAKGWALIAEGAMELSLAYESLDTPAARAGEAGVAGANVNSPSRSVAPADLEEEVPYEEYATAQPLPEVRASHVEAVLSQCPDHQRLWTIKPAGISKNGKPYSSFWRCAAKNGDTWCAKKPVKAWVDSHPIEEGAAA